MYENKMIFTKDILPYYKNPLYYLIGINIILFFLTFILGLDSILILTAIFFFLAFYVKRKQCPRCKRIGKEFIEEKQLGISLKPHNYVVRSNLLYRNGTYMESHHGPEKIIMERIERTRDIFGCKHCNNIWFIDYERNLDCENRPETEKYIQTSEKAPRNCVICGKPLRSRLKYCSDCRHYRV